MPVQAPHPDLARNNFAIAQKDNVTLLETFCICNDVGDLSSPVICMDLYDGC
jgi:hypothetical protein